MTLRPNGPLRTLTQEEKAECPKCEDFVHLIELDEHMNNHLSLQYLSDMANLDSGPVTNNHVSSTALEGSITLARPIDKHDERSHGKKSTAASAVEKPQGTRLGVSIALSFLVSSGSS
jgi:hypothetical protein